MLEQRSKVKEHFYVKTVLEVSNIK